MTSLAESAVSMNTSLRMDDVFESILGKTKAALEVETAALGMVEQPGGDIVFQDFRDGVVYLHMQGSCSGCPSSTATLKMGIENLLKHYVPEVVEVQAAQ